MNLKQLGVLLSISTILAINVIANKALGADPSITFGKARSSGGCVILGQLLGNDGRSLSLMFDKFSAFNGERKTCLVRVNTTIPSGFTVQNVQILYQGSVNVNTNSKGTTFNRSYSFNCGAFGLVFGPSRTTTFKTSDPLIQRQDELPVSDFRCSGIRCSGIRTLALNLVEQSSPGSFISLDTSELGELNIGNVLLHFNLVPCK